MQLWTELHAGAPLQLQLPLGTAPVTQWQRRDMNEKQRAAFQAAQPNLLLGEKLPEHTLRCAESVIG
jgi:hypothetical protein